MKQALHLFLRQSTQSEHKKTEDCQILQAVLREKFSIENYRKLLCRFYAFYKPMEVALTNYCLNESNYHYRVKLPFLEKDLQGVGCMNFSEAIKPVAVPKIDNPASFLGTLYVIEGSTLGGETIRKVLNEYIDVDKQANFFLPYGQNTRTYWFQTCSFIDHSSIENQIDHSITHRSAVSTFKLVQKVLNDDSIG